LSHLAKKPSRQGRYRKSLISPECLAPIAQKLATIFEELDKNRALGILSDAEFLSYGLVTLLACRRLDAFQSNRAKTKTVVLDSIASSSFKLADLWALLVRQGLPIESYKKIFQQNISMDQFFNQIRFRGIPDSARIALLEWLNNQYPLTLFFHIPSGDEVFELQKKGGRCVTFLKQAQALTELHHERDAISFIIHDLIHAHEFYADPQRTEQQIGFYHWLDNIRNNALLKNLMEESAEFFARWEYILSDMNSYCGHLLKTLHAAFTLHAKPGEGASIWNNVVEMSDLDLEAKLLFLKINSWEWNDADFLKLESILEQYFQNHTQIVS
jgi:hypothetical protein